jgi:hypothetical protein
MRLISVCSLDAISGMSEIRINMDEGRDKEEYIEFHINRYIVVY